MKKILLLSDTHGHIDEQILKHAKASDQAGPTTRDAILSIH